MSIPKLQTKLFHLKTKGIYELFQFRNDEKWLWLYVRINENHDRIVLYLSTSMKNHIKIYIDHDKRN